MTPERWQEIKSALHAALDLEGSQRLAYLEGIGAADPDLRAELDSLLTAHREAGTGFLNTPASALLSEEFSHNELAGRRVGNYQLIEEIGSGGMGEVYRAVRADDEYRQEVAIKLVRIGVDLRFVGRRLRTERQILAQLDHPNIARLLDGGSTAEGVPYIVMELIPGVPITRFCHEHELDTQARLKLFLLVCSAVEYAHQHMIIHRDLKPTNILVTAAGVPKLLDFGIAKLLQPDASVEPLDATINSARLLTPHYASPEQLRGEAVSTTGDVYSLGVVLYEVLTGERRETRAGPEAKRAVRPRGDLDNILRMALHPEIRRRYATVDRFAEDIRRHLQHLPVVARRDTLTYRFSSFVARHTLGTFVAASVACALIGGIIITTNEAHIAREQRLQAERRFDDVRKLANALIFDIHDAIRDLPGAGRSRRLLIETALHYLDKLSAQAAGDTSLQLELAVAYERLGDLQGEPLEASEGNVTGARNSYQHALALRVASLEKDPGNRVARRAIVSSAGHLGDLLWITRDSAGALTYLQQALSAAQALHAADPGNAADGELLAESQMNYGYKLFKIRNDPGTALPYMRQGIAGLSAAVDRSPHDQVLVRTLSLAYTRAAEMLAIDARTRDEALAMNGNALHLLQSLRTLNPNSTDYAHLEGFANYDIASLLVRMGRLTEAEPYDQAAARTFQSLMNADPAVGEYRVDLSLAHAGLAQIYEYQDRPAQAIELLQNSFRDAPPQSPGAVTNAYFGYATAMRQALVADAYKKLATDPKRSRLRHRQDWQDARQWYRMSLATYQALSAGSAEAAEKVKVILAAIEQCDRQLVPAHRVAVNAAL
ncbi:MAG: serine/threonine-protein kinase [Steroidobacteraceae bacterium]